MTGRPVTLRKHAIFKNHYRRMVRSTPDYHRLDPAAQWTLLRREIDADSTPQRTMLLDIFDNRSPRRDEVLTALEEARQTHVK